MATTTELHGLECGYYYVTRLPPVPVDEHIVLISGGQIHDPLFAFPEFGQYQIHRRVPLLKEVEVTQESQEP